MFTTYGAIDQVDKARQLNVAHRLLERNVALPEAAQRLARQFGLSLRQAAARFKSILPMRLIDCLSRSLHRHTRFWCLGESASSARE
jgi:hypothetical protein